MLRCRMCSGSLYNSPRFPSPSQVLRLCSVWARICTRVFASAAMGRKVMKKPASSGASSSRSGKTGWSNWRQRLDEKDNEKVRERWQKIVTEGLKPVQRELYFTRSLGVEVGSFISWRRDSIDCSI